MPLYLATSDGVYLQALSLVEAKDPSKARRKIVRLLLKNRLSIKSIELEEVKTPLLIWNGDY